MDGDMGQGNRSPHDVMCNVHTNLQRTTANKQSRPQTGNLADKPLPYMLPSKQDTYTGAHGAMHPSISNEASMGQAPSSPSVFSSPFAELPCRPLVIPMLALRNAAGSSAAEQCPSRLSAAGQAERTPSRPVLAMSCTSA